MLVLMPAYRHYTALSDSNRSMVDIIIKSKTEYYCRDGIDVLIEDEFAMEFFKEKNLLTCTRQKEVQTLESTEVFGEYTSRVPMLYPYARSIAQEYKKAKMPDIMLSYKDKTMYLSMLRKYYLDRCREYIKYYLLDKAKMAIVFQFNDKQTNKIVPSHEENDGILYIYVNLNTGLVHGCYSGMWINEDMLDTLVGGLYDIQQNKNEQ